MDKSLFKNIKIARDEGEPVTENAPFCDKEGCLGAGLYRAPRGRFREGQYFTFCLEHVKAYNQSYNYFQGMTDDDVQNYQRDALTGHRPTWRMGTRTAQPKARGRQVGEDEFLRAFVDDPFGFMGEKSIKREGLIDRGEMSKEERHALAVLGCEASTPSKEIKQRYKELVKKHHPDAHGGDKDKEAKLRDVIDAYNVLKASGRYV
jgi:DnaJ domain